MDEARVSWNTFYLDKNEFECQLTLRDEEDATLAERVPPSPPPCRSRPKGWGCARAAKATPPMPWPRLWEWTTTRSGTGSSRDSNGVII